MTTTQDHSTTTATAVTAPGRRLLVWDGPNIDMTLSTILGGKPEPGTRPSFAALAGWLSARSTPGETVEACVFANVARDAAERMLPWVNTLRNNGFAVFARPKLAPSDDIDDDIIAHVRRRQAEGPLTEVIVASHDFATKRCAVFV